MRVSKMLGGLVAAAVAIVALTASTESRAGGDEDLVSVTCNGGSVTATGTSGWHTNEKAPWKWDKGDKVSVDKTSAVFKGAKCEGVVTAYVCSNTGDSCKGPIKKPVH